MSGFEVRPSDPRRDRRLRWLLTLLLMSLPLSFYLGTLWSQWQSPQEQGEPLDAPVRLAEQEQELEMLRQQLVVVGSGEKLSHQAIEQNRQTIKLLEEQIFKQQQDLAFYKGVLAPASRREGLRIRAFELQPLGEAGHFRYKLLLSRVGSDETPIEGQVHVTIDGQLEGKKTSLELSALSGELSGATIPFSFKHFQSFPEAGRFGELQLPEGFVPSQVKVSAEIKDGKPLERTFEWMEKKE